MQTISPSLQLWLNLSKVQSVISRTFDHRLGQGIGFNEFVILYQLSLAPSQKLRRIDLAESIGLTASGITKLLAPMEKIGLIAREANPRDARVSYVILTTSGERILRDTLERAELLAEEAVGQHDPEHVKALVSFLAGLKL